MTDHAAIDLEAIKDLRYWRDSRFKGVISDLIAAVEALREHVAELDGARIVNENAMNIQRERAEAAQAHATELAGALAALHECSPCQNGCAPDDMTCASNVARTALATLPAQALERAKAKDEVVIWARAIANAGDVVWPEALNRLDTLDQGDGT